MIRKTLGILFMASMFCVTVFANTVIVENHGSSQYKKIYITPDISKNLSKDLSGLSIKDSKGNNVPYFINENSVLQTIDAEFELEEKGDDTYIYIHNIKNLRIDEIIIDTNSMFKRTIIESETGIKKDILNVTIAGKTIKNTAIELSSNRLTGDFTTLIIQNLGDKPINIEGISINYFVDEIIFEDKSGDDYTIEFGRDNEKEAPEYEEPQRREEILSKELDLLPVGDISLEDISDNKGSGHTFFYIVAAAAAALTIFIALQRRKNEKSK